MKTTSVKTEVNIRIVTERFDKVALVVRTVTYVKREILSKDGKWIEFDNDDLIDDTMKLDIGKE